MTTGLIVNLVRICTTGPLVIFEFVDQQGNLHCKSYDAAYFQLELQRLRSRFYNLEMMGLRGIGITFGPRKAFLTLDDDSLADLGHYTLGALWQIRKLLTGDSQFGAQLSDALENGREVVISNPHFQPSQA